jgi:hypothetical protein
VKQKGKGGGSIMKQRGRGKRFPKPKFKPQKVSRDALQLAREDNMICETSIFVENKPVKLKGLLRLFKEVQKTKWLICPKLQFERKGIEGGKVKILSTICSLTNERCGYKEEDKPKGCVGVREIMPTYQFYVLCDATANEEPCPFIFIQRDFIEEGMKVQDTEYHGRLFNAYKAMNAGTIRVNATPKPGSTIFHTLMRGKPRVTIFLRSGTKIDGTILFYEKEPIELMVSEKGERPDYFIPMYNVGAMFVKEYDFGKDLLRKRTIELLKKGHVVLPVPSQNAIYDYCKGIDVKIPYDGRAFPLRDNEHDNELRSILRGIK